MKELEDIKVDLVNSKWWSFNKVDLDDPLFKKLSKVVKKDEIVYSIIDGTILLEDKKLAKESKKLARLQKRQVQSGKPISEPVESEMDKVAKELSEPHMPGKAIMVMTDSRIITIYQDFNKDYKVRKFVRNVEDIQEIDATKDAEDEGLFNFVINFGKVTIRLVTENDINIKHFEFTLDQLIEIEAKKDIAEKVQR